MRKNKGKRFGTLILSLCVSAVIFAGAGLTAFAYTETTGTVSQDNVKVRESASTTATQVSSLKIGDTIDIVDEATDASGYVWYKIRVNKSEYGYVRSDLVSKSGGSSSTTTTSTTTEANASAASLPATTVTSTDQKTATALDNCKVRSGAGTGYDQVGNLTKGDTVTITGEATGSDSKTWYQITYGESGKTGFVRSDLVNITETAPVEVQEVTENPEGENAEAAEGENTEETAEAEQPQETVQAQVGDGSFELKYEDDTWYLYDYEKEQRVQVRQLIEVAEQVPSLTKQSGTYKTVIIALGIAIAALVIGVIILALKLRDSLYYEDEEEEEEFDRYSSNGRRNREEDDEEDAPCARRNAKGDEEEISHRSFRKNAAEDRETSRPSKADRNADDKPLRGASRRASDEDRTVRPERNDDERASRRKSEDDRQVRADRNSEDRPGRRSRREESDERQDRRSEERASRRIRQAQEEEDRSSRPSRRDGSDESPRRRAKNFIGDDDDLEFEFLDLDD